MTSTLHDPLDVMKIRDGRRSNTFGKVRNGGAKAHQGWDLEISNGKPIYAVSDGTIAFVRNVGDYGLQVCLRFEHERGSRFCFYAHLSAENVAAGQQVTAGDVLGKTGSTGNAGGTTPHLHLEIRTSALPGRGLVGREDPALYFSNVPVPTR